MNQFNKRSGIDARKKIKKVIVDYLEKHSYPPTVREIGELAGIKSTATVQHHLTRMLADGTLETDHAPGASRAIRVPGYRISQKEE